MGFRVPPNIARHLRSGSALGFDCDDSGAVLAGGFETGWGGGAPYPLPGYLPWNRLEVGNGDTYGFYWPIGRETEPPLVCTLIYDAFELYPLATSLEAAVRLHVTAGMECDEWLELADDFEIDVGRCVPPELDVEADERETLPYWGVRRVDELLPLDPRSPSLLLRHAIEQIATAPPDFDAAEATIATALDVLPTYTNAWWSLLQLRRRRRASPVLLFDGVIGCLTGPLAFGHIERSKCLRWLRQFDGGTGGGGGGGGGGDFAHDPLWQRRDRLHAEPDEDDFAAYDESIQAYHALGMSMRAVQLRVVYGELMAQQTQAFFERMNFTWQHYWKQLRDDCIRAGLEARLDAMPPA
jgi:hypothetical protein